ncbi:MAG: phosphatidate cytidylyltransferase [Patescibacteria group bacterium]
MENQAVAAREALKDFMVSQGLELVWLSFYRTAASVRHGGNSQLQTWLRSLVTPEKKRERGLFFKLLGRAISFEQSGISGIGVTLAWQIATLFEQTDCCSGQARYEWLAEMYALTGPERKCFPGLEEVLFFLTGEKRARFEKMVGEKVSHHQRQFVLEWLRRIGLGLMLFSWALYAIFDFSGSLPAFWLLIGGIALIGIWEVISLTRDYPLWQQIAFAVGWSLLIDAVIGLRLMQPLVLILAIFVGAGYDVVAMAFGRVFDPNHTRPIFPQLSDRKTIIGTLAGFLGSWLCGLSWQMGWLPNWSLGWTLLAIIPGSLFAFVGDLIPSTIKKELGIRHSGERLPRWAQVFGSHGGALDRCLSVLCTAGWVAGVAFLRHFFNP